MHNVQRVPSDAFRSEKAVGRGCQTVRQTLVVRLFARRVSRGRFWANDGAGCVRV